MTQTADMATSARLAQIAQDVPADSVSLDWVLGQLNERAFGLFLLILALPCCIPLLYGIPQVVSVPLMFVSIQMVIGRRAPWLPARLAARTITAEGLTQLSNRASPWLQRLESLSRPRLTGLTHRPMDRFVGAGLVLFSASILVPLPLTNTVPGIAIVIAAMGLLQRDGILVALGLVLGTAWIASLAIAGVSLAQLLLQWIGA